MPRVIYSVAASLDGYIAGPGGEYDWIPVDPAIDWDAFMGRFDTVLMGRRTYELFTAENPVGPPPDMRTFVFSRTLRAEDHPDVTLVHDRAADVVDELREGSGRDIWLMGGGVLFKSLLEAGSVDQVEVALVPILLGKGLPLLPTVEFRARLDLMDIQKYPSGIVLLSYEVEKGTHA